MYYRNIAKLLGVYFFCFAPMILFPLFFAIYYDFYAPSKSFMPHTSSAFLFTFFTCLAVASFFYLFGRKTKRAIYRREGLIAVVVIWLITPAIASLPFIFSGTLTNPFMAYFEATSGLTTTGASVIVTKKYDLSGQEVPYSDTIYGEINTTYTFYGDVEPIRDKQGNILRENIEAVPKPLLFWRSFLQWIGGVGIIVLFVAILPLLGVGGKILYHAEMAGPMKESFTPRIKETALALWGIYLGLTLLQMFLLMLTNSKLPWFDALTISLSTISTGGFSIKNGSIGDYKNPATEWVVILFMILGGTNFSLYYYCLKGKFYRLFDKELLIYLSIILATSLFVSWELFGLPRILSSGNTEGAYSFSGAIRAGFFQVTAAVTGTGFYTADYDEWPYVGQSLMIILMYVGGMSGSTTGGIKIIRHSILFTTIKKRIEVMFRPETVTTFRLGSKRLDPETMIKVLTYFVVVIIFSLLGIFLLTLQGVDPETSIGVTSAVINNAGLGFREAGPPGWFSFLSNSSLLLTSFLMILGRLEFFAVLLIFVPAFWKTDT